MPPTSRLGMPYGRSHDVPGASKRRFGSVSDAEHDCGYKRHAPSMSGAVRTTTEGEAAGRMRESGGREKGLIQRAAAMGWPRWRRVRGTATGRLWLTSESRWEYDECAFMVTLLKRTLDMAPVISRSGQVGNGSWMR
eukprot:5441141-Prymnesium_polylepis.1